MVRGGALVAFLVGCGRVGFGTVADAESADVATDVAVVCGDGVCAGESGEVCTSCTADCATLEQVCGNGACEPGEDAACQADCGPSPWPWQDEATAMLAAVNQTRATGTSCPGGGGGQVVPALTYDATLEPGAREYAWEAAHQNWTPNGGCNGRTALDRVTEIGAASIWKTFGATSPQDSIAMLVAFMPACTEIMSASNTAFAAAGAHDVITSHAIVLR